MNKHIKSVHKVSEEELKDLCSREENKEVKDFDLMDMGQVHGEEVEKQKTSTEQD
jgi:hypothetical protein